MDAGPVGLFGLGNMGLALAKRLAAAHPVVAFDLDEGRRDLASGLGVTAVGDPAAVAEAAAAVVLSLPAPAVSHRVVADVLAVWDGPGLVIETSTVTPDDARADHQACARAGSRYVDAAILSGVGPVEAGTSTLLVGGDDEAVAAAQPVLDAICPDQRRLGPPGAGMAAKVINNAVAHAVYVVLAEAVAMARATGVALDDLVDLLADPQAGLLRPLTHRIAERVAQGDFEGGMPTEAALKDSSLALQLAQRHGVPLFATQAAHSVYEMAVGAGLARQDYSALATLWDGWAGRPMPP